MPRAITAGRIASPAVVFPIPFDRRVVQYRGFCHPLYSGVRQCGAEHPTRAGNHEPRFLAFQIDSTGTGGKATPAAPRGILQRAESHQFRAAAKFHRFTGLRHNYLCCTRAGNPVRRAAGVLKNVEADPFPPYPVRPAIRGCSRRDAGPGDCCVGSAEGRGFSIRVLLSAGRVRGRLVWRLCSRSNRLRAHRGRSSAGAGSRFPARRYRSHADHHIHRSFAADQQGRARPKARARNPQRRQ